jgi:outer membrane protein
MKIRNLIFCLLFSAFAGNGMNVLAQAQQTPSIDVKDSLTLPQILSQVLTNYPTVTKAQEAIQAAEAGIGMAKSGYYPNINANASYARIDPVSSITIPDMGTFSFMPNNNYNADVIVNANLYDFEKTARKVDLEKSTKELSEKNVELVRQRLTLTTSVSYYSLIYLQEAIKIKETQIATLQEHLDYITLKAETGSATQYEILSTQVRLSNAETQKVDLETSRQTQIAILNSLLGQPVTTPLKVSGSFLTSQPNVAPDSLILYALDHRYEMVMAKMREDHARLYLRSVKVMNNPTLGFHLDAGIKNGYFSDMNKLTPNWVAGIGLNVPIYDATRKKNTMMLANSQISMARTDIDQTSREISAEVYQNETSLLASLKKMDQGNLQVQQAEEALALAQVSFQTGAITNLDLLDAETALAESRVNLLRARTEYAINLIRLNISVGKPIQ